MLAVMVHWMLPWRETAAMSCRRSSAMWWLSVLWCLFSSSPASTLSSTRGTQELLCCPVHILNSDLNINISIKKNCPLNTRKASGHIWLTFYIHHCINWLYSALMPSIHSSVLLSNCKSRPTSLRISALSQFQLSPHRLCSLLFSPA